MPAAPMSWMFQGTARLSCGNLLRSIAISPPQDFTQAELLLALRVVADPNGLFMCGDTCQTIARGIGFRCRARLCRAVSCRAA